MKQLIRIKLFEDTIIDNNEFNPSIRGHLLSSNIRYMTNTTTITKLIKEKLSELQAGGCQLIVYINKWDSSIAILNLINLSTLAGIPLIFEINCKTNLKDNKSKSYQFSIPVYNDNFVEDEENVKYRGRVNSYMNKWNNSYSAEGEDIFEQRDDNS